MGRPRKATALKILDGDRADRINRDEPTPPKGAGECPDHLDETGREAWLRLTRRLEEMGVLTLADGEAVALYCSIYSRWTLARTQLAEDGLTLTSTTTIETSKRTTTREVSKVHPMLAVVNECEQKMTRLLTQFGMTPSSRSSLHVGAKAEDDPLLSFLASKSSLNGKKAKA